MSFSEGGFYDPNTDSGYTPQDDPTFDHAPDMGGAYDATAAVSDINGGGDWSGGNPAGYDPTSAVSDLDNGGNRKRRDPYDPTAAVSDLDQGYAAISDASADYSQPATDYRPFDTSYADKPAWYPYDDGPDQSIPGNPIGDTNWQQAARREAADVQYTGSASGLGQPVPEDGAPHGVTYTNPWDYNYWADSITPGATDQSGFPFPDQQRRSLDAYAANEYEKNLRRQNVSAVGADDDMLRRAGTNVPATSEQSQINEAFRDATAGLPRGTSGGRWFDPNAELDPSQVNDYRGVYGPPLPDEPTPSVIFGAGDVTAQVSDINHSAYGSIADATNDYSQPAGAPPTDYGDTNVQPNAGYDPSGAGWGYGNTDVQPNTGFTPETGPALDPTMSEYDVARAISANGQPNIPASPGALDALQYATEVGMRGMGAKATDLANLRDEVTQGKWGQAYVDSLKLANPFTGGISPQDVINTPYTLTGKDIGLSPVDYGTKQVVSQNPLSAVVGTSGGGGDAGIYEVPVVGGLARGASAVAGIGGADPSINVQAVQQDLASGMSVEDAQKKYPGNIGLQVLGELINPVNFIEIPGVGDFFKATHATAYGRNPGVAGEVVRNMFTKESIAAVDANVLRDTLYTTFGTKTPEEVAQTLLGHVETPPRTAGQVLRDTVLGTGPTDTYTPQQRAMLNDTVNGLRNAHMAENPAQPFDLFVKDKVALPDQAAVLERVRASGLDGAAEQATALESTAKRMQMETLRDLAIDGLRARMGVPTTAEVQQAGKGLMQRAYEWARDGKFQAESKVGQALQSGAGIVTDTVKSGLLAYSPKYYLQNAVDNVFRAVLEGGYSPIQLQNLGDLAKPVEGLRGTVGMRDYIARTFNVDVNIGDTFAGLQSGQQGETIARGVRDAFTGKLEQHPTVIGKAAAFPSAVNSGVIKAFDKAEALPRESLWSREFFRSADGGYGDMLNQLRRDYGHVPGLNEVIDEIAAGIATGDATSFQKAQQFLAQYGHGGVLPGTRPLEPVVPQSGMARGRPAAPTRAEQMMTAMAENGNGDALAAMRNENPKVIEWRNAVREAESKKGGLLNQSERNALRDRYFPENAPKPSDGLDMAAGGGMGYLSPTQRAVRDDLLQGMGDSLSVRGASHYTPRGAPRSEAQAAQDAAARPARDQLFNDAKRPGGLDARLESLRAPLPDESLDAYTARLTAYGRAAAVEENGVRQNLQSTMRGGQRERDLLRRQEEFARFREGLAEIRADVDAAYGTKAADAARERIASQRGAQADSWAYGEAAGQKEAPFYRQGVPGNDVTAQVSDLPLLLQSGPNPNYLARGGGVIVPEEQSIPYLARQAQRQSFQSYGEAIRSLQANIPGMVEAINQRAAAEAYIATQRTFNNYGLNVKFFDTLASLIYPFNKYQTRLPLYLAQTAARYPMFVGSVLQANQDIRDYNAANNPGRASTQDKVYSGRYGVNPLDLTPWNRTYDNFFNRSNRPDQEGLNQSLPAQVARGLADNGVTGQPWGPLRALGERFNILPRSPDAVTQQPFVDALSRLPSVPLPPLDVRTADGARVNLPSSINPGAIAGNVLSPSGLMDRGLQAISGGDPGLTDYYTRRFMDEQVTAGRISKRDAQAQFDIRSGPIYEEARRQAMAYQQESRNFNSLWPGRTSIQLPVEGQKPQVFESALPRTNPYAGMGGTDAGIRRTAPEGYTYLQSPDAAARQTAYDQLHLPRGTETAPTMDYARDFLARSGPNFSQPRGNADSAFISAYQDKQQASLDRTLAGNARATGAGLPQGERVAYLEKGAALDKEIAPGFTVSDYLSQPGNLFDLEKQYGIAKAAGDTQKTRDIGRAIADVKARDLAQHPQVGAYFDLTKTTYETGGAPSTANTNTDPVIAAKREYIDAKNRGASAAELRAISDKINALTGQNSGSSNTSARTGSSQSSTSRGSTTQSSRTSSYGGGPSRTSSGSQRGGGGSSSRESSQSSRQAGNDFYDFYGGITDKGEKRAVFDALDKAGLKVFGERGVTADTYRRALDVIRDAVATERARRAIDDGARLPGSTNDRRGMTRAEALAAIDRAAGVSSSAPHSAQTSAGSYQSSVANSANKKRTYDTSLPYPGGTSRFRR